jgi:hypothetical protein
MHACSLTDGEKRLANSVRNQENADGQLLSVSIKCVRVWPAEANSSSHHQVSLSGPIQFDRFVLVGFVWFLC